jgi:hypothetical protein
LPYYELSQARSARGCHPFTSFRASSERSEASDAPDSEILRCAQDDNSLPVLVVNIHYYDKMNTNRIYQRGMMNELPGNATCKVHNVQAGDILIILTPGGGGFLPEEHSNVV